MVGIYLSHNTVLPPTAYHLLDSYSIASRRKRQHFLSTTFDNHSSFIIRRRVIGWRLFVVPNNIHAQICCGSVRDLMRPDHLRLSLHIPARVISSADIRSIHLDHVPTPAFLDDGITRSPFPRCNFTRETSAYDLFIISWTQETFCGQVWRTLRPSVLNRCDFTLPINP